MAWRRYGRRRYYRRSRFSRRRLGGRFRRRGYGRRRSRSTRSSTVKLSRQLVYGFGISGTGTDTTYAPFTFQFNGMPGFLDYADTYSEFRVVKARLQVSRVTPNGSSGLNVSPTFDSTSNLLVVPSASMASLRPPVPYTQASTDSSYLPPLIEEQLRQSRWQKQYYPNTTTQAITVGFQPFTFRAAFAPSQGTASVYQKVWRGRNWTPMSWVSSTSEHIDWFGPYIMMNTFADVSATAGSNGVRSVPCTLTVWVQFRGQR